MRGKSVLSELNSINGKGAYFMDKRVYIVTGASGFLGNNIVRRLSKIGAGEIRALLLPCDSGEALKNLSCKVYRGDVTQPQTLGGIFEGTENCELFVIHCAAVVYIKTKRNQTVYDVNVNGTKNIVKMTLRKGGKLVYVSSVHAIPEKPQGELMTEISDFSPKTVNGQYAKTKAIAADFVLRAVRERGLNACILHPSGIIGPYDYTGSHLTQLFADFANGRLKACVKGGYDFVDARDVAKGVISACDNGRAGECYILSNRYVEVKQLLDIAAEVTGRKKISVMLPMWLAKATASLSEKYYELLGQPPLYTKYSLFVLASNSVFSNQKARTELGYNCRNIYKTVKDTMLWLKATGKIQFEK